jgi:hypothetical protein
MVPDMLRLTPGFTASAALPGGGGYARARTTPVAIPEAVVAQWGTSGTVESCNCPCCITYGCGFLGLSECIRCCDAPTTAAQ